MRLRPSRPPATRRRSVLPLIESATGLWNARAIAEAPGVLRLAFGSIDFQVDLGICRR